MHSTRKPLPYHSMFRITARLVTHVHHSVVEAFGVSAEDLIREGVRTFGFERSLSIANRAEKEGEDHLLHSYIPESIEPSREEIGEQDIYPWMAQLFAAISKQVVDTYGDQGKDAIRNGVRTFGNQRGNEIANRAAHIGLENTIENYLSNYDMGRSELFEFDTKHYPEYIDQTFTRCPFGEQWAKDDMHEYGILYCEMIDPSIAKGYNKDFEVDHDQYVLKEGVCHFHFKLEKK